jgi:hypothetical protein
MHESRRLQKSHDSSQEAERLKINRHGVPDFSAGEEREDQAQVHGGAAELEREIPPVIASFIYDQIEKQLLIDLSGSQADSA